LVLVVQVEVRVTLVDPVVLHQCHIHQLQFQVQVVMVVAVHRELAM
jgi:hypothetical protein